MARGDFDAFARARGRMNRIALAAQHLDQQIERHHIVVDDQ